MSNHKNHDELEAKIRAMAEGFRRMPTPTTQFHFRGEPLLPMQVAQRLQGMAEGFQSIRDAENARQEAEETLAEALPDYRSFYAEAVGVVKAHYGSDHRKLSGFGVLLEVVEPKRRVPSERPEREVIRTTRIEEVIGDRETRVNEVETEEVIDTTGRSQPSGGRGRERRRPSRPVPTPRVPAASTTPGLPAPTGSVKPSKQKAGQRR